MTSNDNFDEGCIQPAPPDINRVTRQAALLTQYVGTASANGWTLQRNQYINPETDLQLLSLAMGFGL